MKPIPELEKANVMEKKDESSCFSMNIKSITAPTPVHVQERDF